MMTELNQDAIAVSKSRPRKLSSNERLAIYALAQEGVPVKAIAHTFGVGTTAIYYIVNWEHTAAHDNAKRAYELMGKERVFAHIVTQAQLKSINDSVKLFNQGKADDRQFDRNARARLRARRARAIAAPVQAGGDEPNGSPSAA